MNNLGQAQGLQTVKSEVVARQLVALADQIANKATDIAEHVSCKLAVLQYPFPTSDEGKGKLQPEPATWPPLFQEVKDRLNSIERSLKDIDSNINRAEI